MPINFSNGNTWIEQQDYSIPGLGGGKALTRTWNSLWTLALPPEQSGISGQLAQQLRRAHTDFNGRSG